MTPFDFVILKKSMYRKMDKRTFERNLKVRCPSCGNNFQVKEIITLWGVQRDKSSCPFCDFPEKKEFPSD